MKEVITRVSDFRSISIQTALLEEVKATVRYINNCLPNSHPIRQRLTNPKREYVTVNSFTTHALEWLLETLANQEPALRRENRNTEPHSTETGDAEERK
jgi:hypothetical protein